MYGMFADLNSSQRDVLKNALAIYRKIIESDNKIDESLKNDVINTISDMELDLMWDDIF